VGGFTLEEVQAVCLPTAPAGLSPAQTDDEAAVLEQLAQLLNKSLVQAQQGTSGEPRFTMLETIREYATEQLQASGEEAAIRERHVHYFLRLAEEAEPHLSSPEMVNWLVRLESEDANLRAALASCEANQDAVEIGLRLAGALAFYWYLRGFSHEGRTWLEAMLARSTSSDRSNTHGLALYGAGMLAHFEGDFTAASLLLEEALSIGREIENKRLIAYAGQLLGMVRLGQGNTMAARSLFEESYSLVKNLGDIWSEAITLYHMGIVLYRSGDHATARTHIERSLQLFRQQGNLPFALMALCALQVIVANQGNNELAHSLNQQSQQLIQQVSNREALGLFLINAGEVWLHLGEEQQAQMLFKQSLSLWQEMQRVEQMIGPAKALAGLAEIAANQGQAERAGRLFGAATRLLSATSVYRERLNRGIAAARARLDTATFEAGWAAGQTMTEEQAVTEALQDV
jgi:tetratricopeptide (TPR) repeat protein